jgi:DNA-binding HxlR family transcriptional regulator
MTARYDALTAECPTRDLLDRLSSKWVSLLLVCLGSGPQRYSDLRGRIDGVSEKMLTQTLRHMERDGVVTRAVTPSVPIRTDYELTDLGRTLLPIVASLKAWTEAHIEQVEEARASYDTRATSGIAS